MINENNKRLINIMLIICVIPFLVPRGIMETGGNLLNSILYYFRLFVIFFLLICCILYKIRFCMITWLSILFYFLNIVICIIRHTDTSADISNFIYVFGMVLIMEFALYNDISCFIKNMAIIIGIIIVANFITIVMHPGGLYTDSRGWKANWVMGYYNSHIFTYLPWLAFSYMYIYKLRGKLSVMGIGLLVFTICGIYMAGSKTSLVALGIAFIIMVFSLKAFKLNLPNVFVFFIISFVISYLIIFMNFQENFSAILYKYLNRDSSFTGRNIIWAMALKSISRHPILGNGNVSYNLTTWTTTQAHNTYLNIMVQQGLLGLMLFGIIVFIVSHKLKQFKEHPYTKVLTIILVAYFVDFITEMYQMPHLLFCVIFLAYNIDKIVDLMPVKFDKDSKTIKKKIKIKI